MGNNFGLSERTTNELLNYFKSKPEIKKVVIFGSRAKGNYSTGSDIDFAIWSDNDTLLDILSGLEDLSTPYKYDVINYLALEHEGIKNSIDRDGKLFYQRND